MCIHILYFKYYFIKTFILSNSGVAQLVDSRLTAKSKLVVVQAWNHPVDQKLPELSPHNNVSDIQFVEISHRTDVCHALQSQYFHVVLPSNDTRYFKSVVTGFVDVNDTDQICVFPVVSICDELVVVT